MTRKSYQCICLALISACLFGGCGDRSAGKAVADNERNEFAFQSDVISGVGKEECFICGDRSDSLMAYYGNLDSIGIVYWNQKHISNTGVREYDESGNEITGLKGSSVALHSFGKECGSISIIGNPGRGISNITICCKEKDEIDFGLMKDTLCQDCLNKVAGFYADRQPYGKGSQPGTTGYCLVDFREKELYALSEPHWSCLIRDYYVGYHTVGDPDGCGGHIDILITYSPERGAQE